MNQRAILIAFPLSFLALQAIPHVASAQTATGAGPSITAILGTVQRCEPKDAQCGTSADAPGENPHPNGVLANALNFEDCEADLYYFFKLGVSSPSTEYELEAWAGSVNCSQLANRQTSATSVCWPVMNPVAFNASQFSVDIRAQDIVSGAFTAGHPVAYSPTNDPSVCTAQPQTAATPVNVYFFFTDPEANPVGTVQEYPLTVDLRAASIAGNVSVSAGDDSLIVDVPASSDPDTQGYNVYCDPPPGADASTSTTGTASADAGDAQAPAAGGCATSPLSAPPSPLWTSLPKYLCAQSGVSSRSILVEGLAPDVHYNVAVAATDAVGNVGPLSNLACAESGDQSLASPTKSGSCSVQGAGFPAGTSGLTLLVAASSAVFARRRRRSAPRSTTV